MKIEAKQVLIGLVLIACAICALILVAMNNGYTTGGLLCEAIIAACAVSWADQ